MKALVFGALFVLGCNVEPTMRNTGGLPPGSGEAPSAVGANGERCPRGLTVLLSDYLSSQVALSDEDGQTLSASFLSTASSDTDGLAFALSGDTVLPTEAPRSGRIVVIDRFGTNVVTWADPYSGQVLGQLAIGTGFESNPYDYVELDEDRAYVSRFGHNPQAGQQPFDQGDDLLVLDTTRFEILGRIAMGGSDDPLPPRPTRLMRFGDEVLALLERVSLDFTELGDSELVGIDASVDQITWRLRLSGMKGCGGLAQSLDRRRIVVGCTGDILPDGGVADLSESGLIVLDATVSPPVELERLSARSLGGDPIQGSIVFASTSVLLMKTQSPLGGSTHNRALAFDLHSREVTELLRARPDSRGRGKGIVYGAIVCRPGCSEYCFLADADRGVLQRLHVQDGRVVPDRTVTVEERVRLPPRDLSYR